MANDPFAAIEQRVNQGCIMKLANAAADFGGGLIVSGIFDDAPIEDFDVISTQPRFECLSSEVGSVSKGDLVQINSKSYKVENFVVEVEMTLFYLYED